MSQGNVHYRVVSDSLCEAFRSTSRRPRRCKSHGGEEVDPTKTHIPYSNDSFGMKSRNIINILVVSFDALGARSSP